jgi:hypothetical protein
MKTIALAAAVGALALGLATPPAQARTCFRQTVTDSAGHHAMMRGCSVARHHAARAAHRTVTRTTKVVTTDDYVTTVPVRTRMHRHYSWRAPRNEIIGYGSSTYTAPATQYSTMYQPGYAAVCGPGNSSRWGYGNYYGSSSPPWCQASASSHPAFAGGSGQFASHPGFGWGY